MHERFEPLDAVELDRAVEALRRGFADYLVPIPVDRRMLLHMLTHDGVDASLSRLVCQGDVAIGCALVARRGWTSRLAGMAIVPEARGKGVGRRTMQTLLAQARERGDRRMVLEVIERNEPALKLYESLGFTRVRRLVSLERPASDASDEAGVAESNPLQEIDIQEVAHAVARHGLPDLPWQLSAESLALSSPPTRAFRLGGAAVVVTDLRANGVAILSLIVEQDTRGTGQAQQLLRALFAAHTGKSWRVPALCPEEAAGQMLAMGFECADLSQLQLALVFNLPTSEAET